MDVYARRLYKRSPTKYDQRNEYYRYYKLKKVGGLYYWVRFISFERKVHRRFYEQSRDAIDNCLIDLGNRHEQCIPGRDFCEQHIFVIKFKESDLLGNL